MEDLGEDVAIIIQYILKKCEEKSGLDSSVSGGIKWRAFVNILMNFRFDKRWDICKVNGRLLAFQQGLCYMELVRKLLYLL